MWRILSSGGYVSYSIIDSVKPLPGIISSRADINKTELKALDFMHKLFPESFFIVLGAISIDSTGNDGNQLIIVMSHHYLLTILRVSHDGNIQSLLLTKIRECHIISLIL